MKKLKISASFLCLCVVIILTSLAFFYQKGNTTDGTVGSDSPDKENTLKPSASKGSDEFVNDADASEHSQSSHAEIDYSTYESTTLGISISYPAYCPLISLHIAYMCFPKRSRSYFKIRIFCLKCKPHVVYI